MTRMHRQSHRYAVLALALLLPLVLVLGLWARRPVPVASADAASWEANLSPR